MDAETLKPIFEPFFTTKPAERGTGLGLAHVGGIVAQHGGFVGMRSELGRRTTFEIRLTHEALAAPADGGAGEAGETGERKPAGPRTGAGTVLLVDDEDTLRRTGARAITRLGYDVIPCATGTDAVRMATQRGAEIRAVILDVALPDMSGFDVLRSIRAFVPTAGIVFCSGHDEEAPELAELRHTGAALLQKPFTIREFADAVQAAVSGQPSAVRGARADG